MISNAETRNKANDTPICEIIAPSNARISLSTTLGQPSLLETQLRVVANYGPKPTLKAKPTKPGDKRSIKSMV